MKILKISLLSIAITLAIISCVVSIVIQGNLTLWISLLALLFVVVCYFIKYPLGNFFSITASVVALSLVLPLILPLITTQTAEDDRQFDKKIVTNGQKSIDIVNNAVKTDSVKGATTTTKEPATTVAPVSSGGGLAAPTIQ